MQSKTEKELTEVLDRVLLVALLITGNMDVQRTRFWMESPLLTAQFRVTVFV